MCNETANQTHPYLLVVDTNSYSGNFEREMCAYVTGAVGDCGVGDNMRLVAIQELVEEDGYTEQQAKELIESWSELTVSLEDDGRCSRPCSIYPTEGRWNNGRGVFADMKDFDASAAYKGIAWPAYESVVIYFESPLSEEHQKLFAQRARNYAIKHHKHRFTPPSEPKLEVKSVSYIEQKSIVEVLKKNSL